MSDRCDIPVVSTVGFLVLVLLLFCFVPFLIRFLFVFYLRAAPNLVLASLILSLDVSGWKGGRKPLSPSTGSG